MRKTAVVTLILTGLLALGVFCVQTIKAEDQGNITINADGSINPSTAPIQQTSNVYSVISDTAGNITVQASNLILDGNGHTVTGISLQGTSNVTVKNFLVLSQGERFGLSLSDASNNLIINNTVSGFWSIQALNGITFAGIYVEDGNSNTITQNNLMDNLFGMVFIHTSYNLIVQNNITSEPVWGGSYTTGIYFGGASDNIIYRNSFVNNHYQTRVSNSINTWDDGSLGNYWSDYRAKYPSAVQIGGSGVYNIPYSIDEHNIDRYPLTQPFSIEFYAPKFPPKIALLSPINQVFNESSIPLVFTVDKQVSWVGYSLDGKDNITVTGNSTITELTNGMHNVTVYAKDTFGNEGASEIMAFTVTLAPFPIASIVTASAATIVVVSAGLLIYFKKRRATNLKRNNEI